MKNVKELLAKVGPAYIQLQINQRLYVNALVLLAAFLTAPRLLNGETVKGLLYLFVVYWIAAIAYDLVAIYKRFYETILGKALLVVLFSLCANIAIALSSQVVNDIVGVDPSKFPHTIALLSILSIPIFIVAGLSILSMVLIFTIPIFMVVHTIPDENAKTVIFAGLLPKETVPFPRITRIIQLVSFAVFCGVMYGSLQNSTKDYETFVVETARSFLYKFEMYSKAPCKVDGGNRIAYLGDGKILVGSKNGAMVIFKVQECKSGGS